MSTGQLTVGLFTFRPEPGIRDIRGSPSPGGVGGCGLAEFAEAPPKIEKVPDSV